MTGGGRDRETDAGDERSFAERMTEQGDVRRVERGLRATPDAAARPAVRNALESSTDRLRIPNVDEPLVAHRSFVRRRTLRDLRAGRIPPDRTVDLHGLDRGAAARRVREAVAEASRAGLRCVLVVAGRGLGSVDGVPVLRDALPDWLADPALEDCVAAFAPAVPRDGGRGALYVLLARGPRR